MTKPNGSLFGKGKPKPPAPEPDPAVKRAVDHFHDAFLARHGFKPDPRHYGRYGRDIKALVAAWGEEEVTAAMDTFFTTSDPRVMRSDFSLKAFLDLAQHVRLLDRRGSPDARTAANVDAAVRATKEPHGPR